MIVAQPHSQGATLLVRAQPGARRNGIFGERGDALRISVTAAPENGKANDAIVEVLCEVLRLRPSQVILLSGETSRNKRFLIQDIMTLELTLRIQNCLAGLAK